MTSRKIKVELTEAEADAAVAMLEVILGAGWPYQTVAAGERVLEKIRAAVNPPERAL